MSIPPDLLAFGDTLPSDAATLVARLADNDAAVRRIALIELADLEDAGLVEPIVMLQRALARRAQ